MAIKNTLLGGTDWVKEKLLYQDLNDTMNAVINKAGVLLIDTTTDLNFNINGSYQDTISGSKNYTLNLSADLLSQKTHISIDMIGRSFANISTGNDSGSCSVDLEIIKNPTTDNTSLITKNIAYALRKSAVGPFTGLLSSNDTNSPTRFYYELTEDDKTNGIDIQFIISYSGGGASTGASASYTNNQIVILGY